MKILIVYFSYSGNNRLLAEHLAKRIGCDICPIVEKKRRTMLTIMLDMIFKRLPNIDPPGHEPKNYDHIILVAPIWGSKVANPMKTFIKKEKAALDNYSFISFCGHGRAGQQESITKELSTLTGHSPRAVTELRIFELMPAQKKDEILTISRYHVTDQDLRFFESTIDEFCKVIQAS